MLLPGEKGEVAPHLQDKFLQLGENRVLQILFAVGVLKSQKERTYSVSNILYSMLAFITTLNSGDKGHFLY